MRGPMRVLLAFATTASMLMASGLPAFAAPAVIGAFEVDGNLVDDSGPGDPLDWDTIPKAPNCPNFTDGCAVLFTDPFGNQPDTVFQGSKEFEPFNWTFKSDGSAPQKADIKNAGVGQRTIGADDWLYLYFERDGNNGDVFLNFEFNSSDQTYVNSNGSTVPVRTVGDLMVAFFVTKGGSQTDIEVLEWQGDHQFGQWVEPTINPIPVRGTDWEATVNANAQGRFTIGEAALRLQAFDQTPSCPGFGKAWVKTTSSQEFATAALQDRTDRKDVHLSNCAIKDWEFTFDPQPIAGAGVFAVYTVEGGEAREVELTDPDGDGTFTAQDDEIPEGTVTFHFEVRNGTDLIWRSDHDDLTPGKQDGSETFEPLEEKTNTAGLAYEITLTPATAENFAGDDHPLTATVTVAGSDEPLPHVPVSFENTGDCGSLTPTEATTDAAGQATTVLSSATACSTSVRVWVNGSQTGATTGFDAGEANDEATKQFAVYSLTVTPDGEVNEVDSDHEFTVLLTRDVGDGPSGVEGATVDLDLDPNDADAVITTVNGSELMPPATSSSCTTDANGECSVVIHAEDAGDVTLNASADVTNDSGTSTVTGSADKDYVDFRLRIEGGDKTNEVGSEHAFTVVLEENTGAGFGPLAGELVNLGLDPDDTDARIIRVNGSDLDRAATSGTCTTDANGECEVVITKPTAGNVTLQAVWGTEIDSGLVVRDASAQKDYVDFRLTIDGGGATNEVGSDHTFTVTLERDTSSGFTGLGGETVDLTLDPNTAGAGFVSINGMPASGDTASCTTNTNGECSVTINASDPGSVTLNASWSTELDSGTASREDSADKDYVDFRLVIDGGDATNEVGSDHTFIVTLEQDSGDGFVGLAGETVALTLDPNSADARIIRVNGVDEDPPATSTSCVTNGDGQCTVVVNATTPGSTTLNASWSTDLDSGTATREDSADKFYVDFQLTIEGGGQTNAIGSEHEFTVRLEQDSGGGFAGLAGETVSLDLDPDDTDARIVRVNGTDVDPGVTETTCTTDAAGECSVVVNKATPGTIVLNADWMTELDSGTVSREDSADKTYGDIRVIIDNGDKTNEVGADHTFTVTVESDTGGGFAGVEGASVDLDLDPDDTDARIVAVNGTAIEPGVTETTCTTDANGQCTVTISKPTPGDVQLNATYAEELDSGTLTRSASAGKSFVDFRLTIDGGGATNEVGTEHGFTVLLERDTGAGFAPLAGEEVDLFLNPNDADAGIVRVNGSDIDPPLTATTCITQEDGTCSVVIVGTSAGTSVLNALWGTTLDSGDVTRSDTASKDYVDFQLTIDGGDATNEVGSDHTFTVVLERDTGDGFQPLGGETVDLSIEQGETDASFVSVNGDPASGTEASCTTDENGECSVVVTSSEAGTLTLGASWSTELDSGTASRSDEAVKSYEDFRLTIDGGDATNEVGSDHAFTVLLERDTGGGFQPYPGQTVTLSIDQGETDASFVSVNGDPASGAEASCTTDQNGECGVVVTSSEPGTLNLHASWSTELDSGTATRADEAAKSYVDFLLTVTPETAINEPGEEHPFTVALQIDDGSDFTGLAGETIDLTLDPNEPPAEIVRINGSDVDPPSTTDSCVTQDDGTCSVVINATGTGTVVLNASWSTELDSGTASREDAAEKIYLSTFVEKAVICPTSDHVAPGGLVEYAIAYGGEGTTLGNATLTDELPAAFRFEGATPAPTSAPAEGESGTVVWEFGDLPDGTEATVTITGTIDPSTPEGTELVNTAIFSVDGVSDKVSTQTLVVDAGAETGARAYGVSAELLGSEILAPTPDSDDGNSSLLSLDDPVSGDIVHAELLSVQEASSTDETSTHANAIATTATVRVLDQTGDGDWLVTADAVRAVSSSGADITSAGSSMAGSKLVNVTVNGQNLGTVTEPTTIEVTDPVLGTTATVHLLENIARGAADGIAQPDGDFFSSGLDINAIHVTVADGGGSVITDVVVAHASSDARFRSGLGCVPTPTVAATGFALGTTLDEGLVDDSATLFAGEVARVAIPSGGGDESATLEHTGPISLADQFVAESNAAFTRSTGATDPDANTGVADTEAEIHGLRLLGDGPDAPLISADTIRSAAHAEDLDGAQATSGDAVLENLVINGTNVCEALGLTSACEPDANTTFEIPGALLVILNEQIVGDNSITVNAIHIFVLGDGNALGLPVGAEIIVSSAHAAAGAVAVDEGDEDGEPVPVELTGAKPAPVGSTAPTVGAAVPSSVGLPAERPDLGIGL